MYLAIYGIVILLIVLAIAPMMGMNIIFLIIGFILAVAIFMRNKDIHDQHTANSPLGTETLHVVNLEQGGVFELSGVGNNYESMTLKVLAKHLYQDGDYSWFELECDKGSQEKVWVEVDDDDETKVTVVLEKKKLSDFGLSASRLEEIDDEERGNVQGYNYEDSGNAVFYRFCDSTKAEKLYYWDFKKGSKMLSVEKWGDKDYEVFISQIMMPSQIRVLRNKAE